MWVVLAREVMWNVVQLVSGVSGLHDVSCGVAVQQNPLWIPDPQLIYY